MAHLSLFLFILGTISFAAPETKLTPIIKSGIDSPIFVNFEPGTDDRMYVVEQRGKILVFDESRASSKIVFDIEDKIVSGGEMGLLGFAFHPNFATNKKTYINYTMERSQLTTVVSEVRLDTRAERELFNFSQPYSNHNGGHVAFGPDGYLYITTGDGGSAGDPHGAGQNKNTFLGKMLRIDVNGKAPYAIPQDNPFVNQAGAKPEIFAYGLRNVWRFSFDRLTGLMFGGDVGQNRWEEIDIIEKGKNYGWKTMEGKHCFSPATNCDQTGLTLPIHEYPRTDGISITGGYVYRGKKITGLQGAYIYGDYGSGKIWALYYDQTTKTVKSNDLLMNSRLPIASFAEDNAGELYVVSYAGVINRLDPK